MTKYVIPRDITKRIFFKDIILNLNYHLIIVLPQVKPLPKAASTTILPSLILPSCHASVKAIGIEPAVVFPYL
jgi:hypothetical protein